MKFFNLHTHNASDDPETADLVNRYPRTDKIGKLYSIGIHPWYIDSDRLHGDLAEIRENASDHDCLAIGECGLDKRIEMPLDVQENAFRRQLEIAQEFRKPVIIHCAAAFQEIMEVKKDMKISVPMIIHGFSKNIQTANQLLDNGFHLSFGKYLLRNPELEKVFTSIPADRFFLETDTIEESIRDVYEVAARYRNTTTDELKSIIEKNIANVFNRSIE